MNSDLRDNLRRIGGYLLVTLPFFGGGFYTAMIEIAFKHLHNSDRANSIYCQGMAALKDRNKQATLHRLYTAFRSWAEHPPYS